MSNPFLPRRSHLALVLLALAALPPSASAASPVHADPNLVCAGLTPCFATIQEAVDNAGPAPAEVLIFPGDYAESVTLGTMGSAIAESPGNITLQAVDAAGQPTAESLLINPGGSGGPGTGTGLNSGLMGPFPGDVVLRGLTVTSPDSSAVGLSVDGNLVVEDVFVASAASAGLIGQVTGNAVLSRIRAVTNEDSGVSLGIGGSLQATEIESLRNGGDGIALFVAGEMLIDGLSTRFNDNGGQLFACTHADVRDVHAQLNDGNGIEIFFGPDDCMPATRSYGAGALEWQVDPSLAAPPAHTRGASPGTLFAQNLLADNNGNAGIGVASSTGTGQVDGAYAYDNDGPGMLLQMPTLDLRDAEAIGNLLGVAVIADAAELERIVGNQSLPAPPNPPFHGSGVVVSAGIALLDDVQADDNPAVGLLLAEAPDSGPTQYTLVDGQFDGNLRGVQIESASPVDLNITNLTVTNQVQIGLSLPWLGTGEFRDLTIQGNPVGLAPTVLGQLTVERALFDANGIGADLRVEASGQARLSCSDFTGNTMAGAALTLGSELDARGNYWNDPSGPDHPQNPGGSGDAVLDGASGAVGTVDFGDFLAQPATEADCDRGTALPPPPVAVPTLQGAGRIVLPLTLLVLGLLTLAGLQRRAG